MRMIVGLGNPGKKYERTRHNAGFMVIDRFCEKQKLSFTTEKFQALYLKTKLGGEELLIVKPLTYMNESGIAVQALAHFYKLSTEDILVVHDDMDLPPGKLRIRRQGSSGGQKGMASIITHLSTDEIKRIRIGVGRPDNDQVVDFVLGKFTEKELPLFEECIEKAADALWYSLSHSFEETMNRFH